MGKITPAEYMEIHESTMAINKAGEYYYHSNLIGINEELNRRAEEYEVEHIQLRNKIISDAIKNGELSNNVKLDHSLLAISSIKNKTIFLT